MKTTFKTQLDKLFSWYNLTASVIFFIIISIIVTDITKFDRGIQMESLRSIAIQASLFSLFLLLIKKVHSILKVLFVFLVGIISTFSVIGNLASLFLKFLQALSSFLSSFIQYLFQRVETIPTPDIWQESWSLFGSSILVLFDRLRIWFTGLPSPVYDPISINLIAGIGVWLITIWLFWFLINRKKALFGVLPSIALTAAVFFYRNEGVFSLAWIVGFGLLMEIISKQSSREDFWNKQDLNFSKVIRNKSIQYALYISILSVLIAGTVTSPELKDYIQELKRRRQSVTGTAQIDSDGAGQLDDIIEDLTEGPENVIKKTAFGRMPNNHLVGSGPELAEIEVMYVHIDELNAKSGGKYYLRSATYDTYNLQGWRTNDKGFIPYQPELPFAVYHGPNEKLIYQEIQLLEDAEEGNLMYVVGDLVAADVTYYASYHTKFIDDTYEDIFASVTNEPQYSAYSSIPYFGENELRNSSLEYPSWIINKYLQIPDSVPDRVYQLALDLTATQPTTYDRVLAIEHYLRGFEYTLDLVAPPRYKDIVDHFLFDLQKGFCDYFASSMVILARAAGIPARLAIGYSVSTYDVEMDQYIVTADQAHSWVEVYFPEYSWVVFEPTSGQAVLERSEVREVFVEEEEIISEEDEVSQSPNDSNLFFSTIKTIAFTALLIIVVYLSLLIIHWLDRLILKLMSPEKVVGHLYNRLKKYGRLLGLDIKATDTPLEFSKELSNKLVQFGETSEFTSNILNSSTERVRSIISACIKTAYSTKLPENKEILMIIGSWNSLRWQLIYVVVLLRMLIIENKIRRFSLRWK